MAAIQVPVKIGKYAPIVNGVRDCGELAAVSALVDDAPGFAVFPASLLSGLGIEPQERARFAEVDGGAAVYGVGSALLEIAGDQAPCQVIFGPEGRSVLRRATLLAFGLQVAPDGAGLEPAVLYLPSLIAISDDAQDESYDQ